MKRALHYCSTEHAATLAAPLAVVPLLLSDIMCPLPAQDAMTGEPTGDFYLDPGGTTTTTMHGWLGLVRRCVSVQP